VDFISRLIQCTSLNQESFDWWLFQQVHSSTNNRHNFKCGPWEDSAIANRVVFQQQLDMKLLPYWSLPSSGCISQSVKRSLSSYMLTGITHYQVHFLTFLCERAEIVSPIVVIILEGRKLLSKARKPRSVYWFKWGLYMLVDTKSRGYLKLVMTRKFLWNYMRSIDVRIRTPTMDGRKLDIK
jgi:hypothetical protein